MTEKKKKKNIKAKLQEARVRLQQTSLQKSGENAFARFSTTNLKILCLRLTVFLTT